MGSFSTLVLVDFRRLALWQQALVLISLVLVIAWTLFESRREISDHTVEPEEEERREVISRPRPSEFGPSVEAPTRPTPPSNSPERPPVRIEGGAREEIQLPAEEIGPVREDLPVEITEILVPFPEKLTEVWENYFSRGDGRFTAEGLRRFLSEAGLHGEILSGESLGVGEGLLAIDLGDGGSLYLLPDFGKTVRSIAQWFHAPNTESRLARISRLVRPAVVQRTAAGLMVKTYGVVE